MFRPLLSEFVVSMPRGAAVVYPKDAAQIVAMADIFPGAHVVEAGVGSGALTCSLLRAVGPEGRVSSYERREEFADVARQNVTQFFGGEHPAWSLTLGDLAEALPASGERCDRVILDMLAPVGLPRRRGRRAAPGRHRLRVRRHHHPALPVRRDPPRARRLHRAARVGVPGPRLARRGPRRAPGALDDRAHRRSWSPPAGWPRGSARRSRSAGPRRAPTAPTTPGPRPPGRPRRARRRRERPTGQTAVESVTNTA